MPAHTFGVTEPEVEFESLLHDFRDEGWYPSGLLAIHSSISAVSARDPDVFKALNAQAGFWNMVMYALQSSMFVTLHRLFDSDSMAKADRILSFAVENVGIFSRRSLGERVRRRDGVVADWVEHAAEPTSSDILNLRGELKRHRKVYEAKYRPIRSHVFAHRVATRGDAHNLYAATDRAEPEEMCAFFCGLHDALWQAYFNGESIPRHPSDRTQSQQIASETEQVLLSIARATKA